MGYSYIYNAATGQPEFVGLSTDEKPLHDARLHNGMPLIEMDTSTIYFFDSENRKWWPFSTAGGSSGGGSAAGIIPEGGLPGQYLTNDGEDNLEWDDLPESNHVVGTLTRIANMTQGPEPAGAVIDSGELHIARYDGITVDGTYKEGDVFYVTCDKPCAVGISHNDGETFVELEAHKTDTENKYAFTLPMLHEQFVIGIILRGDADGDGVITLEDAAYIIGYTSSYGDSFELNGMRYLAADANGDGVVDRSDATRIQRYLGETDYSSDNKIDWNVREHPIRELLDAVGQNSVDSRTEILVRDYDDHSQMSYISMADLEVLLNHAEDYAAKGFYDTSGAFYSLSQQVLGSLYSTAMDSGIATMDLSKTLDPDAARSAIGVAIAITNNPACTIANGFTAFAQVAEEGELGVPHLDYYITGAYYSPSVYDDTGDDAQLVSPELRSVILTSRIPSGAFELPTSGVFELSVNIAAEGDGTANRTLTDLVAVLKYTSFGQ